MALRAPPLRPLQAEPLGRKEEEEEAGAALLPDGAACVLALA